MTRPDQRRGRTEPTNRRSVPAFVGAYNHSLRLLSHNEIEAFRLNKVAADEGMHDAVLAMGWFYLNGVGVGADKEAAVRWYRKSARQGDARAMFSLGQIAFASGDYSEALLWFGRASDKGHSRSAFWIGKLHWRGLGVSQDRRKAGKFFASAAAEKLPEAQRTLRYLRFLAQFRSE